MAFQRDHGSGELSRLDLLYFPRIERITYIGEEPDALCLIGVYGLGSNPASPFRPIAPGRISNRQQRAPVVSRAIVEVRRNGGIGAAQPADIVGRPPGAHAGELVEFFRPVVPKVLHMLVGALPLQCDRD